MLTCVRTRTPHLLLLAVHAALDALDPDAFAAASTPTHQGDISSVFGSLLGETFEWPDRFGDLKDRIRPDPVVSV
jgi:hypothetical protein